VSEADLQHAFSQPHSEDALRPLDIKLKRAEQELRVRWADGCEVAYPATLLRKKCPCATCRTQPPKPAGAVSLPILGDRATQPKLLVGASLVGRYAIQLQWSDGHDTGIYDFRYLRGLEAEAAMPERSRDE
jgi:DUF971 family protein